MVHWDSRLPGRGIATGPRHVKPTCPKPSSFVFLPDLLLQEAHGQVGGPCYSSPFLASCSMSQQSGQLGSEPALCSLHDATAFLSSAMVRQKGRCLEMARFITTTPARLVLGRRSDYLRRKVCWPVSLSSFRVSNNQSA